MFTSVVMVSLWVALAGGQDEHIEGKFELQPSMPACAAERQHRIDAMRAAGDASKYRSYQILCIAMQTTHPNTASVHYSGPYQVGVFTLKK